MNKRYQKHRNIILILFSLIVFCFLISGCSNNGLHVKFLSNSTVKYIQSCNVLIEGCNDYHCWIGSGVIINENGLILTAAHCVDGAAFLQVTLHNGDSYTITDWYTDDTDDVAFIKLPDVNNLPYAEFGNSDELEKGENVYSIGEYDGMWDDRVTYGKIHKIHFKRLIIDFDSEFIFVISDIASGCSGGGLYKGSLLIGIVVMGNGDKDIMLCVPINDIKEILEEYKEWPVIYPDEIRKLKEN